MLTRAIGFVQLTFAAGMALVWLSGTPGWTWPLILGIASHCAGIWALGEWGGRHV